MNEGEPFWTASRVASGAVVVVYVVVAALYWGGGMAVRVAGFCVLPVACIWFSDVMGRYRGIGLRFPVGITSESPPSILFVVGWLLLLLPALLGLLVLVLP